MYNILETYQKTKIRMLMHNLAYIDRIQPQLTRRTLHNPHAPISAKPPIP